MKQLLVLLGLIAIQSCADDGDNHYFEHIVALNKSGANQSCINSWLKNNSLDPVKFLPEKSIEMPPKMDDSLVEEALADHAACESLPSCWDSDSYGSAMFMQVCTRGRMKLRVEQYDYDFGG